MITYIVKSTDKNCTIKDIQIKNGYAFNPKNNTYDIKNLILYDPSQIEKVLVRKYIKNYQRLASIVKSLFESDDSTDSDYMICLDEIEKLEGMLIYKYQKYMKRKLYEYFLNDLIMMQKALENKFVQERMFASEETIGSR